jgi:quinol monooxygenase YgiN
MIVVGVALRVPHANFDVFQLSVEKLIRDSRAEPGVLAYSFAVDVLDSELFRIFEIYESQSALDAHMQSPHFLAWRVTSAAYPRVERWLLDATKRE